MNPGGTLLTAFLRSFYIALATGALAFLTAWQTTDDTKAALITGGIAGLTPLVMRGGVEGFADRSRQIEGDVKASDVQVGQAGSP